MVFEHMAHGDLHEFLIFHSPKSDLNESEDSGEGRVLTQSEMSYIAIQIAAGEGERELHFLTNSSANCSSFVKKVCTSTKISCLTAFKANNVRINKTFCRSSLCSLVV